MSDTVDLTAGPNVFIQKCRTCQNVIEYVAVPDTMFDNWVKKIEAYPVWVTRRPEVQERQIWFFDKLCRACHAKGLEAVFAHGPVIIFKEPGVKRYFKIMRGGSGKWIGVECDNEGYSTTPWPFAGHCPMIDKGDGVGKVLARQLKRQVEGEPVELKNKLNGGSMYHFVYQDGRMTEDWYFGKGDPNAAK